MGQSLNAGGLETRAVLHDNATDGLTINGELTNWRS